MKRTMIAVFFILTLTGEADSADTPLKEMIGNATFEKTVISGDYSSSDVFHHFRSACINKGVGYFVAPQKDGRFTRLTLLNDVEAVAYAEINGDGRQSWLFACEGATKFLVEKEHQYKPGQTTFILYRGRALEGVDYVVRAGSGTAGTAVAQDGLSDNEEAALVQKVAIDLAEYKTDFIRTELGTRLEGRYASSTGSCDLVSVTRMPFGNDGTTTQNFKVCSGRAYPINGLLTVYAEK